jgi:hypothetical protein
MAGLTGNSPHRAKFAAGYRLPVTGQARLEIAGHAECDANPGRGFGFTTGLEQTEGAGTLRRPAPAVNLKLGVDVPYVNFDRIHRQVKLIADFP